MANFYLCKECGLRSTNAPNSLCTVCMKKTGAASSLPPLHDPSGNPFGAAPNQYTGSSDNPFGSSANQYADGFNNQQFGGSNNPFQPAPQPVPPRKKKWTSFPKSSPYSSQNSYPNPNPYSNQNSYPNPNPAPVGTQSLKIGRNKYRGSVQCLEMHHVHRKKPSFTNRLFRSLFTGSPFSMAPAHCTAQISVNSNQAYNMGGYNTSKTILFFCADDDFGVSLRNGNVIEVEGPTGSDGTVYPTSIYNCATGTIVHPRGIPAWIMRIAAIALILLVILLADGTIPGIASFFDPSWFQRLSDVFSELIVIGVLCFVLLTLVRTNPRVRNALMWIAAIVLCSMVMPGLGGIILMILFMKIIITGRLF